MDPCCVGPTWRRWWSHGWGSWRCPHGRRWWRPPGWRPLQQRGTPALSSWICSANLAGYDSTSSRFAASGRSGHPQSTHATAPDSRRSPSRVLWTALSQVSAWVQLRLVAVLVSLLLGRGIQLLHLALPFLWVWFRNRSTVLRPGDSKLPVHQHTSGLPL